MAKGTIEERRRATQRGKTYEVQVNIRAEVDVEKLLTQIHQYVRKVDRHGAVNIFLNGEGHHKAVKQPRKHAAKKTAKTVEDPDGLLN